MAALIATTSCFLIFSAQITKTPIRYDAPTMGGCDDDDAVGSPHPHDIQLLPCVRACLIFFITHHPPVQHSFGVFIYYQRPQSEREEHPLFDYLLRLDSFF